MAIEISNLSFSYGNEKIIDNINITFPTTGMVVILGRSGSGKTTFLSLLTKEITPLSGTISGIDKSKCSRVYQSPLLLSYLNVIDNVAFSLLLNGVKKKEAYEKATEALKQVDMAQFKNKSIKQLSGGEQTRVSIARALVDDKEIFLLDEPTGQLDKENGEIVYSLLKKISKHKLIILVTHDQESAYKYADIIYELPTFKKVDIKKEIELRKNSDCLIKVKKQKVNGKISMGESIKLNMKYLKTKLIRCFLSTLFLSLNLTILFLCISIKSNIPTFLKNVLSLQYNYNVCEIQQKESIVSDGHLKIDKFTVPKDETLKKIGVKKTFISLDGLIPSNYEFTYNDHSANVRFLPVFNQNKNDLLMGNISNDNLSVIVNQNFLDTFQFNSFKKVPPIRVRKNVELKIDDDDSQLVDLSYTYNVCGLSKEKTFLNEPTVYYNYNAVLQSFDDIYLKNQISLSNYLLDLDYNDSNNDLLSHKKLFLNDKPIDLFEQYEKNEDIKITSSVLSIYSSTKEMISSLLQILDVFIALNIATALLVEFMIVYSLYEENMRLFALIFVFSPNKKNKGRIRDGTSIIFSVCTLLAFIIFVLLITNIVNMILSKMGFPIIFSQFNKLAFIIISVILIVACYFSSSLPLLKIKDGNIKKELEAEE